jgi:hypothetical protein
VSVLLDSMCRVTGCAHCDSRWWRVEGKYFDEDIFYSVGPCNPFMGRILTIADQAPFRVAAGFQPSREPIGAQVVCLINGFSPVRSVTASHVFHGHVTGNPELASLVWLC